MNANVDDKSMQQAPSDPSGSDNDGSSPTYVEHEVIDLNDNVIGTVVDVLFNDADGEPEWLVVKPGLLQAERYVPIEGSYPSVEGNIVVPFDKRLVKAAPKAGGDHLITPEVEEELENYYGVTESADEE